MDFSNIDSITIPEGNVTKITDASGRVLWQKQEDSVFQLSGSLDDIIVIDGLNFEKTLSEIAESAPILVITEGDSIHIRLENVTVLKAGIYQDNMFTCTFKHYTDNTTTVTECGTLEVDGATANRVFSLTANQKVSLDMTFPSVFTEDDEWDTDTYYFRPVIKYVGSTIIDFSKYVAIEYQGGAGGAYDEGWLE